MVSDRPQISLLICADGFGARGAGFGEFEGIGVIFIEVEG
jgi:hypothetical protein